MKTKETFQTATLETLTPELGHFIVTGAAEDVQAAATSFHARQVPISTFERALRGQAPRRFRLGQLLAG